MREQNVNKTYETKYMTCKKSETSTLQKSKFDKFKEGIQRSDGIQNSIQAYLMHTLKYQ